MSLSQRLVDWLNGDGYPPGHPITDEDYRTELQLGDLLQIVATLADNDGGGASLIGIDDAAGFYDGTTVETALANLATALGGTDFNSRNYTGGTGTRLTDDDSFFVAINKLDAAFVALLAVTNGNGAALVGIEDAGAFITGVTVEAALAELGALRMRIVADPGTGVAIPVTSSADIQIVTGGAGETNTLADPPAALLGGFLHLRMLTDGGGDRVITAASPVNATGNTILTFAEAGDDILLQAGRDAAGAYRWVVAQNDGVALS